jgi:hypothetical protein
MRSRDESVCCTGAPFVRAKVGVEAVIHGHYRGFAGPLAHEYDLFLVCEFFIGLERLRQVQDDVSPEILVGSE